MDYEDLNQVFHTVMIGLLADNTAEMKFSFLDKPDMIELIRMNNTFI